MNGERIRVLGHPEHERGFTLIELMIVTVIVAILAGIAAW
jgi:prepilin-type N-terminal cleavage/methylation domain-containing protein